MKYLEHWGYYFSLVARDECPCFAEDCFRRSGFLDLVLNSESRQE
jgi:hypothetical protein